MDIEPMGDSAILVRFASEMRPDMNQYVRAFSAYLDASNIPWLLEQVPALTTITLYYDAVHYDYRFIERSVQRLLQNAIGVDVPAGTLVDVPVCYGGIFGEDLDYVADYHGLSKEDVIHIHTSCEYLVYMIGFAPGFPYLGGMSERIATPRKAEPRISVAAGSVGIAGQQTGVYPMASPGGWQIIGRTPIALFQPSHRPPSLLKAGDKVRFRCITEGEFERLSEKEAVH